MRSARKIFSGQPWEGRDISLALDIREEERKKRPDLKPRVSATTRTVKFCGTGKLVVR